MGTVLLAYLVLFIGGALVNVVKSVRDGMKFNKYMEERHPTAWREMMYEQPMKSIYLWPFFGGSAMHFVWKSTEDFGDPGIQLYRSKLRWSLYGWLIYLLAGFLGLVLLGVLSSVWDLKL